MVIDKVSPSEIDTWLCWAGKRLLSMPSSKVKPQEYRSYWPDVVQELNKFEKLNHGDRPLRASAPTKEDIPIVDTILTLPNRCSDVKVRRVLHARSLIHPINDRHIYGWSKLARLLHVDRRTVKHWHNSGLEEIADNAEEKTVWLILRYFA